MNKFKTWIAVGMLALVGASLLIAGCNKGEDATGGPDTGGEKKTRDAGGLDEGGDRAKTD